MKKLLAIIQIFSLGVFFSSCSTSQNDKLIIGNWSGTEWLIDGKPSNLDALGTSFNFDEAGNYNFIYSGNKQTGTYKVENDMLFTTPAGQLEMMVRITKLTQDSLVFDMNRGGRPESLFLIRK